MKYNHLKIESKWQNIWEKSSVGSKRIPTSHDTKYKSKAWIDMFGLRFGKMIGAFCNTFALSHGGLIGGLIFGILAAWGLVAHSVGSIFQKITEENKIID